MKKILLILFSIIIMCQGIVYASIQAAKKQKQGEFMNKKVLVAYFSWGGNTKLIAEKIHSQTGGDIIRIEPLTPYPDDYQKTAYGVAKEQKEQGIHPAIKKIDVKPYEVIFLGTPAWWYTMAPPVMTFLAENNFEGKTIIPFVTHGGGGGYSIDKDMAKLAKGAKVLDSFIVYERGDANIDEDISVWLNKIK